MLSTNNASQVGYYALPRQLRIGLYVYIDLPWFRHPFTLNSFKINSEQQIRDLRALDLPRYRYDPERSEDAPSANPPAPALEADAPAAAALPERDGDAAADPRVEQLRNYRKAVARTEKSFVKAVGVVRRLSRDLLSHPTESLQELGDLVAQMVAVFLTQPEVTLQVMGEDCCGEDVHHHSLNVSVLCMMLVKGLGLSGEQAGMLGAGALLHDIGLAEVPGHILRKSCEDQTKAERELRAMHVEYGARIGRRLRLAPEVMSIIVQHHELGDGTGYPFGLGLEQIAPLARVVSLVNFYDNLCNPVDFARAMTPHEALSFIFARRKDLFDTRVLQLLIRSLGVYPPGSIVELSNETIAMVVSVNPHKPLRPWVIVYDADVPKEEAVMRNLELEDDMAVSKAIRPALLPPPVYAYLSPRKRISYFFDAGPSDIGGNE